jgi:hypothetical protein
MRRRRSPLPFLSLRLSAELRGLRPADCPWQDHVAFYSFHSGLRQKPFHYSLWPYWETASSFHSTSSYTRENTIVRAEFNLYNAKDEKLLWSGETDTIYSEDFDKLGKDYAKMLVKQLKRDKVIGHQ